MTGGSCWGKSSSQCMPAEGNCIGFAHSFLQNCLIMDPLLQHILPSGAEVWRELHSLRIKFSACSDNLWIVQKKSRACFLSQETRHVLSSQTFPGTVWIRDELKVLKPDAGLKHVSIRENWDMGLFSGVLLWVQMEVAAPFAYGLCSYT